MKEQDGSIPGPLAAKDIPLIPEEGQTSEGPEALEVFDPLKKYLAEIRKFPLLSREEENELAKRWWHEKDR